MHIIQILCSYVRNDCCDNNNTNHNHKHNNTY